jgi:hypothetical protein
MPTLDVDPSMYDDCLPVTELWVYMNNNWVMYEPNDGNSNMPFVQATAGLKADLAGDSVYVELNFSFGMDTQYEWGLTYDTN